MREYRNKIKIKLTIDFYYFANFISKYYINITITMFFPFFSFIKFTAKVSILSIIPASVIAINVLQDKKKYLHFNGINIYSKERTFEKKGRNEVSSKVTLIGIPPIAEPQFYDEIKEKYNKEEIVVMTEGHFSKALLGRYKILSNNDFKHSIRLMGLKLLPLNLFNKNRVIPCDITWKQYFIVCRNEMMEYCYNNDDEIIENRNEQIISKIGNDMEVIIRWECS